ncbi:MAG: transcriptional repressor [Desulfovibrio sp.]|nr:transcriptional repressor [Desulfovibrio sp.]
MTSSDIDPQSRFLQFMSRKGLNTTSQRKAIAEVFFGLPGHHSLEEFYREISRIDPGIGQTTVYRTLKLLCEAGLANEIQLKDNITRYEIANPNAHHDHLICARCGKIVEICDPRIEELQKEIAEKNGFKLFGHSHNLYGACPDCRDKNN